MYRTDLKEVVRGDGDFVEYGSGYLETVGKYIKDSFDNGATFVLNRRSFSFGVDNVPRVLPEAFFCFCGSEAVVFG